MLTIWFQDLVSDPFFAYDLLVVHICIQMIAFLARHIGYSQNRAAWRSMSNTITQKKILLKDIQDNGFENIRFFVKVTEKQERVSKTGAPWREIYFFTWEDKEVKAYGAGGNIYEIFISPLQEEKVPESIVSMNISGAATEMLVNEQLFVHFTRQTNAIDAVYDNQSYIMLKEFAPEYILGLVS